MKKNKSNIIYYQRYERIQKIGEGAFGKVYLAYDKKDNKKTLKEYFESALHDVPLLALKKTKNNDNMVNLFLKQLIHPYLY